jgi:hypothetical protein
MATVPVELALSSTLALEQRQALTQHHRQAKDQGDEDEEHQGRHGALSSHSVVLLP